MRSIRMLSVLVVLMVSVSAFAQSGDDLALPSPGGTGAGSGDGCWQDCTYIGIGVGALYAVCIPGGWDWWSAMQFPGDIKSGHSNCTVSNPNIGPPFCQMSGWCLYNVKNGSNGEGENFTPEEQIEYITKFIFDSKKPDGTPWFKLTAFSDFIAVTDRALRSYPYAVAEQKRLDAYRARFAALTGRTLKPGYVPVAPHKPVKAHAPTTAEFLRGEVTSASSME